MPTEIPYLVPEITKINSNDCELSHCNWAEFKNSPVGGLLGVPVGKTSPSKIPHALRQKKKKNKNKTQNIKQKQKYNKVNKDFRIDSHQRNFFIKKK